MHADPSKEPSQADLSNTSTLLSGIAGAVSHFRSNDPQKLAVLLTDAREQAAQFLARFTSSQHFLVTDELTADWNAWARTNDGEAAIGAAVNGIIEFVHSVDLHGSPAHDRRHLLKDVLAGLRFCLEDALQGVDTLFLIPALMHDSGRLVEPKLARLDAGYQNEDHCAVGFWATKSILDATSAGFPESLRDHLLYAVLQHQGKNDDDKGKFFLYATQRGDREQIPGAEGLTRQLASDLTQSIYKSLSLVGNPNESWATELPPPYSREGHSWFHHLEFYLRNLHPSVGTHADERADALKVVTGHFLLIASPRMIGAQIFAPELARSEGREFAPGKFKTPLSLQLWERIITAPPAPVASRMSQLLEENTLKELLDRAVHPPFAARTDTLPADGAHSGTVWDVLTAKVAALQPGDSLRFCNGMAYLIAIREHEEAGDLEIVRTTRDRYRSTSVPYRIAEFILREYHEAGIREC